MPGTGWAGRRQRRAVTDRNAIRNVAPAAVGRLIVAAAGLCLLLQPVAAGANGINGCNGNGNGNGYSNGNGIGNGNGTHAAVAPFRVTGFGGSLAARYQLDDAQRSATTDSASFQTQGTIEEEVQLWAEGYTYHPDLLCWRFSGGPVLVQQAYDSTAGDASGSDTLLNFAARLDFLPKKPYPFAVYFNRGHPTLSTNLAGSFLSETTEYGASASLRDPLLPVRVDLDASHIDNHGAGFERRVDDTIDIASVRLSKSYRGNDWVRLGHTRTRQESASGSPNLPVLQIFTRTDSTDFSAENVFGGDEQVRLRQQGNLLDQTLQDGFIRDYRHASYAVDLRAKHSPAMATFYRYNYSENSRDALDSRAQDVQFGVQGNPRPALGYDADAHASRERSNGFSRDVAGARGSVNYTTRDLGFGVLSFGGSWYADRTDQVAGADRLSVFDERITMSGTTVVALRNPNVVAGTVVVRNLSQTQVFAEGQDYRLVVVGSRTSLQRLLGGNILDGETVLVDYDHRPGGTVRYDSLGQSYSATATLLRHLTVFATYHERSNSILNGNPTQPLNDVSAIEVGASVDYPLGRGWAVGGEMRHTDHDEDIAPYVRDTYFAYVDVPVPAIARFRLAAYRETMDNAGSPEDVDLVRYTARAETRLWGSVYCTLDAEHERDTGGTLERRRNSQTLGVDWSYRRVRVGLRAQHFEETQGLTRREDTTVRAFLTREF